MSHEGSTAGIDFGLQILGSGGNIALSFDAPPVADASLENWRNILGVIASEVVQTLGYRGIFVVLDNAENVDNEQLTHLLMAFHDTLFTTRSVWWVIIGQSGLYSLIDAADKRVSPRIQGNGIEVPPLSADELHEAIERRVQRYGAQKDALSPISRAVHTQLYEASRGEIRFVLSTSDALLRDIVAEIRKVVMKEFKKRFENLTPAEGFNKKFKQRFGKGFEQRLGAMLVEKQIPDAIARQNLRKKTSKHLRDLRLKKKELQVLETIGEGEARASDHQRFKVQTMQDFSSNYLTKMYDQNLLHRRQADKTVYYGLRGYASLAHQFGLFENLISKA